MLRLVLLAVAVAASALAAAGAGRSQGGEYVIAYSVWYEAVPETWLAGGGSASSGSTALRRADSRAPSST